MPESPGSLLGAHFQNDARFQFLLPLGALPALAAGSHLGDFPTARLIGEVIQRHELLVAGHCSVVGTLLQALVVVYFLVSDVAGPCEHLFVQRHLVDLATHLPGTVVGAHTLLGS